MSAGPSTDDSEDTRLLERARHGDADAFGAVYRRHNRLVLAFLARRVPSQELAADLLAETFAQLLVLVRAPDRELPDVPVAWLLTTARRLLIDAYRRGRVEADARRTLEMQPMFLDDGDLERISDVAAETDLMSELAELLPADQLEALRARVLEEQTYAQIAGELRCSEAVVRQRVSRALRTLRKLSPTGGHRG